jgi:hypothetical protein
MDLQDISTVDELLLAVDEYLKTPRLPPIKGSELNTIISKAIIILLKEMATRETILPVSTDLSINWQTDLVPGDAKTFAEKHGNSIGNIEGTYVDGDIFRGYKPGYSYTMSNGIIQMVSITEVFPGTITII